MYVYSPMQRTRLILNDSITNLTSQTYSFWLREKYYVWDFFFTNIYAERPNDEFQKNDVWPSRSWKKKKVISNWIKNWWNFCCKRREKKTLTFTMEVKKLKIRNFINSILFLVWVKKKKENFDFSLFPPFSERNFLVNL